MTNTLNHKENNMIAVSLTLILALLVGYYLTAGPTIEGVDQ